MPLPSPKPPPKRDKPAQRRKRSHGRRVVYNVRRDELSTIAEESSQHRSSFSPADSSISVDLQPEVVVVETNCPSPPLPVVQPSSLPRDPPPYSGTATGPSPANSCCSCNTVRVSRLNITSKIYVCRRFFFHSFLCWAFTCWYQLLSFNWLRLPCVMCTLVAVIVWLNFYLRSTVKDGAKHAVPNNNFDWTLSDIVGFVTVRWIFDRLLVGQR